MMPLDMGMPETVFQAMFLAEIQRANRSKRLIDIELKVYTNEFGRIGLEDA